MFLTTIKKFLLLNAAIFIAGGLAGVAFLHYVQVSVEAWLNPWADIGGKVIRLASPFSA
jgi:hypothetical protein